MSVKRFQTVLLLYAAALAAHPTGAATTQALIVERPEGPRRVLLAQPDGKIVPKRPLVILLHGHSGTATQLLGLAHSAAPMSVWLSIADREGLLLAVPDGAKGIDNQQGWNDCRTDAPGNPRTDDVSFIAALIDLAIAKYAVDPARVYVMGMSNGGFMVFRLATELPDKFAAFAAVSASMGTKSVCKTPTRPVPMLMIAGDADPIVPYPGGALQSFTPQSRGTVLGIEEVAAIYRKLDGLPTQPAATMTLPHRDANDHTSAVRTVWGADPKRAQVELMRIKGGGHAEPSTTQRIAGYFLRIMGPQNGDFESAEEAWEFFKGKKRAP